MTKQTNGLVTAATTAMMFAAAQPQASTNNNANGSIAGTVHAQDQITARDGG